jgi:hypothetical protein
VVTLQRALELSGLLMVFFLLLMVKMAAPPLHFWFMAPMVELG